MLSDFGAPEIAGNFVPWAALQRSLVESCLLRAAERQQVSSAGTVIKSLEEIVRWLVDWQLADDRSELTFTYLAVAAYIGVESGRLFGAVKALQRLVLGLFV